MALMLLFIHFVLASAAVLVTMNGMPTIRVSARVRHAPFMLAGLSSRTPDPVIRIFLNELLRLRTCLPLTCDDLCTLTPMCPQRPHIVIESAPPVDLRFTMRPLRQVSTRVGPGSRRTPSRVLPLCLLETTLIYNLTYLL